MEVAAFRSVWLPYADRSDPVLGYWHVTAGDAGEADIYASLGDEDFDGFMISRFSAGEILELLLEFIRLADAVVLPPGCPTLLAFERQRLHLPEVLRPDAVVVRSSADVQRVFQGC